MPVIEIELRILAPAERVFDLSRSVDLHVRSTAWTHERAVAGVTRGLLSLDDQVTWEAVHFGVRQRLTSRIRQLTRVSRRRPLVRVRRAGLRTRGQRTLQRPPEERPNNKAPQQTKPAIAE